MDNMTAQLKEAWPKLPAGLEIVAKEEWEQVAKRIPAYEVGKSAEDAHPINDFTIPLARLAGQAGFEDDEANKFIESAMEAARVPRDLQRSVATAFAVQLLAFQHDS